MSLCTRDLFAVDFKFYCVMMKQYMWNSFIFKKIVKFYFLSQDVMLLSFDE